ncbi:hypothetical protein J7399_04590 [Shimia sp. R9_1]|uniref:hypothetical protein n=1 Tax=Shimia sp. R9_1 TaxID=2821111 RepID=UPI001ADAC299|nr:hypothetical protein [Shimia sp. R9_1]MBO9406699.1 hypothetical protein [Shimia sp. R9_1]
MGVMIFVMSSGLTLVFGDMGMMYGAVLGATLFIRAQTYLQNLMGSASEATAFLPLIPYLLDPDRWLMWLGILFILSVYRLSDGHCGSPA